MGPLSTRNETGNKTGNETENETGNETQNKAKNKVIKCQLVELHSPLSTLGGVWEYD